MGLSIIASRWFFLSKAFLKSRSEKQIWLRDYSLSFLFAVLAASALSPVTMQGWYILIALIPACIPLTEFVLDRIQRGGKLVRAAVPVFLAMSIITTLLFVFGQDKFIRQPFTEEEHISVIRDIAPILPDDIEIVQEGNGATGD